MARVCIIQGPNLNTLGLREPSLYGNHTLDKLHQQLIEKGRALNLEVDCIQSNHEGELVTIIQQTRENYDYIIINAAAYTHTSIAIRDALLMVKIPAIEVHITNIYGRESFRHKSLLADVVKGQICGLGVLGYFLALEAASFYIEQGGSQL